MSGATWRVAGASVRGTCHARNGQPCQDAHHWEVLPGGVFVAAVADGAGSASLAELGSAVAACSAVNDFSKRLLTMNAAIEKMGDQDLQELLTKAVEAARQALETKAKSLGRASSDLATTLILMVASPTLVAAAQIGDGATVTASRSGEVETLTIPVQGEYLNETTFLSSADGLERLQLNTWRGEVAQVALLSDGLQMLALHIPAGRAHSPFFEPLFAFVSGQRDSGRALQGIETFLQSPRIAARTDDDLTLLVGALVEEDRHGVQASK